MYVSNLITTIILANIGQLYNRKNVVTIWKNLQGIEVSIKRRRVVIRNLDGVSTGFIHRADEATFRLLQYGGDHHTEPANNASLISINMYSKNMSLLRRVEMESGNTVNDYIYEYKTPDPTVSKSLSKSDLFTSPLTRKCIAGRNSLQDIAYNSKGQIDSGSYIKDGDLIRFQYHYQKAPKYNGALLRAEFVLPYMSCTVSWCASPRWKQERLESWVSLFYGANMNFTDFFRFLTPKSPKPHSSSALTSGNANTSMTTTSILPS